MPQPCHAHHWDQECIEATILEELQTSDTHTNHFRPKSKHALIINLFLKEKKKSMLQLQLDGPGMDLKLAS